MSRLLTLFLSLHLASCSTKILYDFATNYNTQIDDSSGNSNHGQKVAIGSATTVNTPYGLYLKGSTVDLPPNSYAGSGTSNVLNSSDDFSMAVFLRFIKGKVGVNPRPIITLKSGGTTRLQLGETTSKSVDPPVFELTANFGGTATTLTSATYVLCNPLRRQLVLLRDLSRQSDRFRDKHNLHVHKWRGNANSDAQSREHEGLQRQHFE
jgi:hypothetical protein